MGHKFSTVSNKKHLNKLSNNRQPINKPYHSSIYTTLNAENTTMPQVASKLKKLPRMATERVQKRLGRVFCVTGFTGPSDCPPATTTTLSRPGQSDSESNSSGYLSSSSMESSSEEKRLGLNEHKVFQVWEHWSQRRDQPRNSTPKSSTDCTYKARINLSIDDTQHNPASRLQPVAEKDSFWDIATPQLYKSRSETDMRRDTRGTDTKRGLFTHHDAGSIPNLSSHRSKNNDWKRKPYQTMSTSDQDLRASGGLSDGSQSDISTSGGGYQSLPRYRVVVDQSTCSSSEELVSKLTETCADFTDSGVPVDDSMTEFLANVDRDNLASLLNFYDKVTSTSAYERARKNPNNYEAVFY